MMRRANLHLATVVAVYWICLGTAIASQPSYSWRYYRPSNTGIQGDYCDGLWIGPDNDPWIGGYNPSFEEGGLAKLVQAENRWINVSNVDYPVIGHPDETGTTRVRDITPDAQGNLWMGTGRGVLKFNPTIGPSSLVRYGADNSPWPGGWVTNIEISPDGMIWASGYGTSWGGGGLMRFNPATGRWTFLGTSRPEYLAVQPKPGGGYYVWAANPPGYTGSAQRYDSTNHTWSTIPDSSGNPRNLPGNKCVDSAGNLWIYRVLPDNFNVVLDCRRPDGTWIGVPPPPGGSASVLHVTGPLQVLAIVNSLVYRFDGTNWTSLGDWGNAFWTYDLGMDSTGAVWACGVGGAAKRDADASTWQRYRVTNSSQYDFFNNDLSVNQATGEVWAAANAGTGYGGMVHYDGSRWIGYNNAQYGLGYPWPFPTDNSQAIYQRPSTGAVAVNPMFNGTSQLTGNTWTGIPGGSSDVVQYVEDSTGRLWQLGEYFYLAYWTGSTWNNVGIAAWGAQLQVDPDRPGTIWAQAGYEVTRTDGVYRFSRTIDDFPELTSQSDTIWGMAADRNGVVWLGCSVYLGAGGTGGGLIRLDSNSGNYTMMKYEDGWPFPGKYLAPRVVTPDGRVWMSYINQYQSFDDAGLCWYDGTNVGVFPGPTPSGSPQWGGLPHAQIYDVEVRVIPKGYELWMSCPSRGIAVLTVQYPGVPGDLDGDGDVDLSDLATLLSAYGACFGDPKYMAAADFDASGCIDLSDLALLISNYGA